MNAVYPAFIYSHWLACSNFIMERYLKMIDIAKKRENEKQTVRLMIEIYCRRNHRSNGLCGECGELAEYAEMRVERCPYMETKTFCSKCKTQCYNTKMREKIRKVMRFSGPRMIFYSPVLVIRHKMEERK